MPKKWVTEEQDNWFYIRQLAYNQARLVGRIGIYLDDVVKEFNKTWAVSGWEEVIGDSAEAIAKRAAMDLIYQVWKKQIRQKFNNECHKAGPAAGVTNSVGNLAALTKKKKKVFNLKPEEILEAMEELHEKISEAEEKQVPADYLEAIDQALALLECLLQEVAAQTGWWFSVIAGGSLPTDNGNIHTPFNALHSDQLPPAPQEGSLPYATN
ncbi:hypothetical protein EDD18DRAFT_1367188 [Armillaria luteobubalina]|uniref:Uncharacterized protein n=1 Tax=Armillaria luteobubalina TaxID=153913 RepID=A0AA39P0K9_9AGAR|nr:hypothetical protein EDD18DRAFT_1367188 [Armillaria luteobubalina]